MEASAFIYLFNGFYLLAQAAAIVLLRFSVQRRAGEPYSLTLKVTINPSGHSYGLRNEDRSLELSSLVGELGLMQPTLPMPLLNLQNCNEHYFLKTLLVYKKECSCLPKVQLICSPTSVVDWKTDSHFWGKEFLSLWMPWTNPLTPTGKEEVFMCTSLLREA